MQLLLDVWREASRQSDIAKATTRISTLIARHIPADYLAIRRWDTARARLETAATGVLRPSRPPPSAPTELARQQSELLTEWCRDDKLMISFREGTPKLIALVAPNEETSDVVAGALTDGQGMIGVLVVVSRAKGRLDHTHLAFIRELREPFSAALSNDLRVQELKRLREALEADKRALLQRLDRQEVSETIVGADSGLRSVLERVQQVAPTDAPVLIYGETGTGKEVVARAIHARSRRANGPIVRVNCGALPPGLLDSELFGHERGSFTGAVTARKGWFERADGGTLFLDEVGELPPDAQVRLLRILQDGTFERVGGSKPQYVDIRVVAATHRNLQDMVTRGTFREDLWYRIGVFPLHLPPLRERPEDVPALAAHFALRAGMRMGGAPLSLSPDDIDLLVSYAWPGNVRELASVIERAAILGDGRRLRLAAALGNVPGHSIPQRRHGNSGSGLEHGDEFLTLDQAMARHIERALEGTNGRVEGTRGAAARLGINPHTLRARMRKLGVDWAQYRFANDGDGDGDPHWGG